MSSISLAHSSLSVISGGCFSFLLFLSWTKYNVAQKARNSKGAWLYNKRTHYSLLNWATRDVLSFFIKQVVKIYCNCNVQLHSQTKINLIKTQCLKEWWLLGLSHSSRKILWCPENSLKLRINWKCQKDLRKRHHRIGWNKDNSNFFATPKESCKDLGHRADFPGSTPGSHTFLICLTSDPGPNLSKLHKP